MPTSPYLNTSRTAEGRYRAEVYTRGRRYHLGYWPSAEDAARAAAIGRSLLPDPVRPKRHRVMIAAAPVPSAHVRAIRRRVVERLATYDQPQESSGRPRRRSARPSAADQG